MNEEELKELKELTRDIMKQKLEKIKLAKEENFKEGFQKGKLEILNKLNETYPDLKTQEDRKIFVKWKEQLQKEIGGGKDDN